MPEDDRWRRGRIKGSFNEQSKRTTDKDRESLTSKFNKEQGQPLSQSERERLNNKEDKILDELNEPARNKPTLKPRGNMRAAANQIDHRVKAERQKKLQKQLKRVRRHMRETDRDRDR